MNNSMQENAQEMNLPRQDDDEISLWDILDFLKDGWRWLAVGVLAGAVGAGWYRRLNLRQWRLCSRQRWACPQAQALQ